MVRLNLNQIDLGATLDVRRGSKNAKLETDTPGMLPNLGQNPADQIVSQIQTTISKTRTSNAHNKRKFIKGTTANRNRRSPDIAKPDELVANLLKGGEKSEKELQTIL